MKTEARHPPLSKDHANTVVALFRLLDRWDKESRQGPSVSGDHPNPEPKGGRG